MAEIDLILAALGAGVSAGITSTTQAAVGDLYAKLRDRFCRGAAGNAAPDEEAVQALDGYRADPDRWESPLAEALKRFGAGTDAEVMDAARRLVGKADLLGPDGRTYVVDASGAQGVQVGDHNTQHNSFN